MSVYKHPTRSGWQTIKISHGRKSKPEYIPFQGTKEEALIFERELKGITNVANPMFEDHYPEFLVAYKNRVKPRTILVMESSMRRLTPFLCGFRVRQITPTVIEKYKAKRLAEGVKKRSIEVELNCLGGYFSWLRERCYIECIKPKKFSRRETAPPMPMPLDIKELKAILDALEGKIKILISLMALCGLRDAEAKNLEAHQVNLSSKTLTLAGKGGKYRMIPYPDALHEDLQQLCEDFPTGPLLKNPRTNKAWVDLRWHIQKASKKAGITRKVSSHLFRHSFSTALINGDTDIRVVQELLGHSDINTTMVYTQISDANKRRATSSLANDIFK